MIRPGRGEKEDDMYARITISESVDDVERAVALIRESVGPRATALPGSRGITASQDLSTGAIFVLTLWETEDDMRASEAAADQIRSDTMNALGSTATVERYEQTVWVGGSEPPGDDARLHVREIAIDPSTLEDNLEFFRSSVMPELQATEGFGGVRQLIDRGTGRGYVGTVWANERALEASLANSEARRARASERGVSFGAESVRRILYSAGA
jgi:heme-degrading monooxygenase HmoA